jgi:hypothetical protein
MSERPTRSMRGQDRESTSRSAGAVVAGGAILLAAAAVGALVVSFASYTRVKHRLDSFASDHDASLTRHRFSIVVWELRAASLVLLVAAVAVVLTRGRLAGSLSFLSRSVKRTASQAWRGVLTTVRGESRWHLATLGVIVVTAVLLRLDFLFQPMRYDEAGTYIHYASEPIYVGLSTYTAPNNHLFHTLLVHLSTSVFGSAPWAIRLPAFVAGVLVVPASYVAARALYGRDCALLTAALVAASSRLVEYSTNARGYTLITLIFVLMLGLAVRLTVDPEPGAWLAFAVLAALGLWTVPTMLYAIAVVVAWLVATILLQGERRLLRTRLVPSLGGATALTLLLYSPALVSSGPHALLSNDFVTPRGLSATARALPRSFWNTVAGWHRDIPIVAAVLLALAFFTALVLHKHVSRFRLAPALGAIVIVPMVLAQRVVPYDRVWLFLIPLYLMTAAAGLLLPARHLVSRRHGAAAVAAVAVVVCASLSGVAVASRSVAHSEDTSTFRDAPQVASFLKQTLRPGDRVLVSPPADLILEYYLRRAGLDTGRLLYTDFPAKRLFAVVKEGPRDYRLPEVIDQHLLPRQSRSLVPAVISRFPHTLVYRLFRASRLRFIPSAPAIVPRPSTVRPSATVSSPGSLFANRPL